ncbi:hypothetical protein WN51_07133 [Melipona quadrifasciata]|uniref:G-protein coupled receptors family 1 profile domain-containing protein n=1 Tax=Melipona quadrifasciata TaxID=166423 RepID=A0A0N0BCN1_9HYME|nr:hypothetical protein WN51_07133 [Melipona quadrifasciata]
MALWLIALIIFAPVLRAISITIIQYPIVISFANVSTMDFSQNISCVSCQPPVFYICSEDFMLLGIRAPLFGTVCFVLVYAIPENQNSTILLSKKRSIILLSTFSNLYSFPLFGYFHSSGFIVILSYSMMGRTLCTRKPPFYCDSVEGSASSQQVSSKII